MTTMAVIGMDSDTGKLLWRFPHINRFQENCETVLHKDGFVYASSGYRRGSDMLKLTYEKDKVSVERVWTNRNANNLHGGPIWHDGHIYGVGYDSRGWFCLDAKTGEMKCRTRDISRGCLTFADGMLYCFDNRGRMSLIAPSPEEFKLVS